MERDMDIKGKREESGAQRDGGQMEKSKCRDL